MTRGRGRGEATSPTHMLVEMELREGDLPAEELTASSCLGLLHGLAQWVIA